MSSKTIIGQIVAVKMRGGSFLRIENPTRAQDRYYGKPMSAVLKDAGFKAGDYVIINKMRKAKKVKESSCIIK